MNKTAELEVLLFVTGEEGVTLRDLSGLLNITPSAVTQQIEKLTKKYTLDNASALTIIETAGKYRLATKAVFKPLLQHYAKTPMNQSLSKAALEVLAIIAYKQPVTKLEIEQIRGVNCDYTVQKLLEKELISIAGKSETVGKPLLYATSGLFMDYFGINSTKDLPQLTELVSESNVIGDQSE